MMRLHFSLKRYLCNHIVIRILDLTSQFKLIGDQYNINVDILPDLKCNSLVKAEYPNMIVELLVELSSCIFTCHNISSFAVYYNSPLQGCIFYHSLSEKYPAQLDVESNLRCVLIKLTSKFKNLYDY